jgi:hypothetical protein
MLGFKVHIYLPQLWFSYVDLSLKYVDLVLYDFYVLLCWSYIFGGIYLLLPLSYFWSVFLAARIFY